jgi:hypothetical protein
MVLHIVASRCVLNQRMNAGKSVWPLKNIILKATVSKGFGGFKMWLVTWNCLKTTTCIFCGQTDKNIRYQLK